MIKITESVAGQTKSTLFKEEILLIGDSQGGAHIPYSGRGLKNEHVKIFKQTGEIWVQNLANDPFVTLNNQPFFKKRAQTGDVIKIRDIELKLELIETPDIIVEPSPVKEVTKKPTQAPNFLIPPIPVTTPPASLDDEEIFVAKDSLKNMIHHDEEVFHAPLRPNKEPFIRPSLKDYDLSSDKDSGESESEKREEAQRSWTEHLNVSPFRNIRLFSFFIMGFLLVMGVVGVELYLRASEKSDEDELKAAASISDISMALTYAQLYHISPLKHNWSDPEFIQNNLLATLPTGSPSDVQLNCQGEFGNCDFILRVYTSNDLSRFLVVAHPTPSLLQWLIPRSALVVDSSTMEIRRIKDLKVLNRLLASLHTLDGGQVTQITDLVKKGEIILLSQLAKAMKKPEFAPPRLLASLRPGAENLIYNAPRYHPFGGALLKKAEHFSSIHTSSHELAMFQSELEMLKRLTNLVLYTTDTSESGKFALAGLKMIAPDEKYILASIKYDNKGRFRSTKIEFDTEHPERVSTVQDMLIPKQEPLFDTTSTEVTSGRTYQTKPYIPKATAVLKFGVESNFVAELFQIKSTKTEKESQNQVVALQESVEEAKSPFYVLLEKLSNKRQRLLAKIDQKLAQATFIYLKDLNEKKLIARIHALGNKKKDIEFGLKEKLFDIIYDHGELSPEKISETTQLTGLHDLYEEVLLEH